MKRSKTKNSFEILFILLVSAFILLSLNTHTVLAENGTDTSLQFVSSVPEKGAVNVEPFSEIAVTFNQDVVNTTVRDNNANAITLWVDQKRVDAEIKMSDDLIDPEDFGTIRIVPKENLKTSQLYTIKIDTSLTSTKGDHLQTPVELHFTTVEAAKPVPVAGIITTIIIILVIGAVVYGIYNKRRNL